MNLIRTAGRLLLGGYFIANGASLLTNPQKVEARSAPLAQKISSLASDVAPEQVRSFVPESTTAVLRVTGGMQIAGGLGMVTGLGRRFGGFLAALGTLPHAIAARGDDDFGKQIALLGGALLTSQDLAGKPSLSWRADQRRKELESGAEELSKKTQKQAKKLEKKAQKQAKKLAKQVDEVLPN